MQPEFWLCSWKLLCGAVPEKRGLTWIEVLGETFFSLNRRVTLVAYHSCGLAPARPTWPSSKLSGKYRRFSPESHRSARFNRHTSWNREIEFLLRKISSFYATFRGEALQARMISSVKALYGRSLYYSTRTELMKPLEKCLRAWYDAR